MIEISPEIVTLIMLGGVLVGVLLGYPLALPVGAVGLIVGYVLFGEGVFQLYYIRIFDLLLDYVLLAIPLFVFMGIMLQRSGIADKMYEALYLWFGGLTGGLAIITVIIGTILAASMGIVAASVTMLTIFALPSMIKRGYDKSLASGAVCAGGTLGLLIPPSVGLVVYGMMAFVSVGKLFFGAFLPGLLLSGLYCIYIFIRCKIQPKLAPTVPPEERAIPFAKKTTILLTAMVPPVLLIVAVLGTIFLGIAPPTEAAAVGAFATIILTVANGKFSFKILKETMRQTLEVTSMVMLIGVTSFGFTGVFLAAGCGDVIESSILNAPFGRWGAFALIMFIIFILGFFMVVSRQVV